MNPPKLHLRDLFWLVLVCACLCAWLARERQLADELEASKLREATLAEWISLPMIATPREFMRTVSEGTTVLHFDAEDTMDGRISKTIIARFYAAAWNEPELRQVRFCRIECNQLERGPVFDAAKKWLLEQGAATEELLLGGAGGIVWVRDGHLLAEEACAARLLPEGLLEQTRKAFVKNQVPQP